VEVVVSDGEIAAPVAGRLYLPEKWAADAARRQAAGVPLEVGFQAKPAIALELIKQVLADDATPAPVLGDEVYGSASELRWELRRLVRVIGCCPCCGTEFPPQIHDST